MNKINLYLIKMLKKLKVLKHFNFSTDILYKNKSIKIPFILGSGLPNYILKTDWLDMLIDTFAENGKSFVDVGVNIGQTLIKYKTLFPQGNYIGFEPNSVCVCYVNKLINLNFFENSSVYNIALSSSLTVLSLEKTSETDPRASVVESLRPNFFQKKEPILGINYDILFLEYPISFVKIDVEGGELEVITGMKDSIMKYRPMITCEVLDSSGENEFNFTQKRASYLCDTLKLMNYKIIRLHTNKNSIISTFEIIKEIEIVQWTEKSLYLNDYIFYPSEKEKDILAQMKNIVSE